MRIFPAKSGTDGWFLWRRKACTTLRWSTSSISRMMGKLGNDQLTWLQQDLAGLPEVAAGSGIRSRAASTRSTRNGVDDRETMPKRPSPCLRASMRSRCSTGTSIKSSNTKKAISSLRHCQRDGVSCSRRPAHGPQARCCALLPDQLRHSIGYRTVEMYAGDATTHNVTLDR